MQCAPPSRRRGGAIATVEDGKWIVTLAGGGRDYPPTDERGFREFARTLPDPRFAEAYEASNPLTPIVATRSTENRLWHYEDLARRPEGWIVIGDAVCAFNPVYGQGMSVAAVAAVILGDCLQEHGPRDMIDLAARFQRRLSKANSRPWLLATGSDFRYEETEGPSPPRLTRFIHRYVNRVTALAAREPRVHQRMIEVLHLVRSPASLFNPQIAYRVLRSCIPPGR
jgi:2-polyprenyl-6-methoxyphenol hydroxylase-like FAD-dependent oxidoreductase